MKKIREQVSFSGKVKRSNFLRFIPVALLVWLGAAFVDETWLAPNLCQINEDWICYLPGEVREGWTLDKVVALLLLIPLFSLMVRRMHDHGRSGFWSLLALPLIVVLSGFVYFPEWQMNFIWLGAATVIALPLLYWLFRKSAK